jgi:hypothetical protein
MSHFFNSFALAARYASVVRMLFVAPACCLVVVIVEARN